MVATTRVLVLGAAGRDFHDFATVLRDDPAIEVVGFTAAQIPGIDRRTFPAALAGAEPAATLTLTLTQCDVEQGKAAVAIDAFVASLAKTPAPIARLS